MNTNPLRERIQSEKPVFGLFVSEFYTPWIGTILHAAHYDFCIFDLEHGALSLPQISAMVAGFQGNCCTPLVRIPAIRREIILPLMDLGVGGIMAPGVETAEEVEQCIEFMKYPPLGSRGLSLSRPHAGFAPTNREQYLTETNRRNILIIQIESAKAVENLEAILGVPGIDVVFVGCSDLSLSLGVANDPTQGKLHTTLTHVVKTAQKRGIASGANVTQKRLINELLPAGLRFITCSTDTKAFLDGISAPLQLLRSLDDETK